MNTTTSKDRRWRINITVFESTITEQLISSESGAGDFTLDFGVGGASASVVGGVSAGVVGGVSTGVMGGVSAGVVGVVCTVTGSKLPVALFSLQYTRTITAL